MPDGFQDVTLDFGRVYASLPGVGGESDDDDGNGSEDDEEDEVGDSSPGEGGILANLSGGRSKRQRTA